MQKARKCKRCGAVFESAHPQAVFCCSDCRVAWHEEQNAKGDRHESFRARKRAQWSAASERRKAMARSYYADNPKYRAQAIARKQKRKASMLAQSTGENVTEAVVRIAGVAKRCHWCGCRIARDTMDVDHVFPLARGGAHAAFNLVPSCRRCNRSKRDMDPNEFIKKGQLVLL